MQRELVWLAVVLGALGCGEGLDSPVTLAEIGAPAGDTTSCGRTQAVTSCTSAIACGGTTLDTCAARGCWIVGSGLVLYADHSWSNVTPQPGEWQLTGDVGMPRELVIDGQPAGTVAELDEPIDFACDPKGGL